MNLIQRNLLYSWIVDSGSRYVSHDSGLVTVLFVDGKDLGSAQASKSAVDANGEWFYDSAIDAVYYYNDSSTSRRFTYGSRRRFCNS